MNKVYMSYNGIELIGVLQDDGSYEFDLPPLFIHHLQDVQIEFHKEDFCMITSVSILPKNRARVYFKSLRPKWKVKFDQSVSEIKKFGHVYIYRTDDEFSIVMFRRDYFVEVCKNCKVYDRTANLLGDFCTLCEDFDY
jgi:hypothetical protein